MTTTQADPLREALEAVLDKALAEYRRTGVLPDATAEAIKTDLWPRLAVALAQSAAPQGEGMRDWKISEEAQNQLEEIDRATVRYGDPRMNILVGATPIPSDRAGREEEIARVTKERDGAREELAALSADYGVLLAAANKFEIERDEATTRIAELNAAALRQSASAGIERAAEWLPILTAPKSSIDAVLLSDGADVWRDVYWSAPGCGYWKFAHDHHLFPAYWRPLPKPPRSLSPSASRE